MRGSLVFTVSILLIAILLLRATVSYPPRAQLFPLITLFILLILLIIQIIKELLHLYRRKITETVKPKSFDHKYLTIWIWMAATALILWICGFMATVILLPFLYLRFEGESWLLCITLSLGCSLFFYLLFGFFLKMPFYPGLLSLKLFG